VHGRITKSELPPAVGERARDKETTTVGLRGRRHDNKLGWKTDVEHHTGGRVVPPSRKNEFLLIWRVGALLIFLPASHGKLHAHPTPYPCKLTGSTSVSGMLSSKSGVYVHTLVQPSPGDVPRRTTRSHFYCVRTDSALKVDSTESELQSAADNADG